MFQTGKQTFNSRQDRSLNRVIHVFPAIPDLFRICVSVSALNRFWTGSIRLCLGLLKNRDPSGIPVSLLFFCILGSMVNIPIRRIRLDADINEWRIVSFFGIRFRPPKTRRPDEMVLAINVGGAIIPAALSVYLLLHSPHPLRMLLALAAVTFVVYRIARPHLESALRFRCSFLQLRRQFLL